MRMQKHNFRFPMQGLQVSMTRGALAALLCLGIAGSASAGTVYSWQTDDGTFAYTDDRKRIPARYLGQAKARSTSELASYKRFTQSSVESSGDHSQRLGARLDHLREGGAVAMMAPGPGGTTNSAAFLVRMSGNRDRTTSQMRIPMDGPSSEPVTIDSIRVRPDSVLGPNGSLATRHITVVRQGDRVISVTRPNHNQRKLDSPRESDVLK